MFNDNRHRARNIEATLLMVVIASLVTVAGVSGALVLYDTFQHISESISAATVLP